MRQIKNTARAILVGAAELYYGREPGLHRIASGPLKGRRIYMAVHHSIRMVLGRAEPLLARRIFEITNPGDCVYDVGAHVGYTALLFAQRLKGQGEVHAFELLPSTAAQLQKTVDGNTFSNITVHNVGLGRESQTLQLTCDVHAMASLYAAESTTGRTETCQVVALDNFVAEMALRPPNVIKMDVERAELDALHGGSATIQAHRPVLLIEFHTLALLKEGFELLSGWSYRLSTMDGQEIDAEYLRSLASFHQTALCFPKATD